MAQILTFTVGDADYAIESRRIVEVLPLVPGRAVPHVPDYIRGVITYRGSLVPLIDLGLRLAGRSPPERLSTRVIVVEFDIPGRDGRPRSADPVRVGLVAENVVAIRSVEEAAATLPIGHLREAPYLGSVLRLDGRTVQLLDVARLLPPELADGLFPDAGGVHAP
jgi:chemotaxis signal transduction protein